MKKYFVLLLMASSSLANAQWDKNGGIIFCKWGYQGGSTNVSNYFYETNPTEYSGLTAAPSITASRDVKYNNKAIFCEIEVVKPQLIFGMRFGWGLKKRVTSINGFTSQDATYFNTYFGYGFHVKGKFSFIPTARYNYSVFFQNGSPVNENATKYYDKLGGNQRGFGLNFVLPLGERLMLRAAYYYEWIFREQKTHKGLAKTPEVEVYLPMDDDHTFGFAFKLALPRRQMYDNFDPDNTGIYRPATTFNSFIWETSVSIPLPSASTTTYTITVID